MENQPKELMHIIEAILFVAGEPVLIDDIEKTLGYTHLEVRSAIDALASDYDYSRRGLSLKRFGNYIQLATRSDYAVYVEQMLQPIQRQSLSQAAMETLALVAYRQPVTKGEIEAVRGVKCDYSIQSLVKKELIKEVGRKETLGRPILYGTTDQFLSHFGLEELNALPPLPQLEEEEDALQGAEELGGMLLFPTQNQRELALDDPSENLDTSD